MEVRFQDLSIDADIAVGARGEPTVLNAYRNTVEVLVMILLTVGCDSKQLDGRRVLHDCC